MSRSDSLATPSTAPYYAGGIDEMTPEAELLNRLTMQILYLTCVVIAGVFVVGILLKLILDELRKANHD